MTYVTYKFRYRLGNREDFAAVEVEARETDSKTQQSAEILARQWVEDLTAEKGQTYVFIDCNPLLVATERVSMSKVLDNVRPDVVSASDTLKAKAARA